MNCDAGMFAAGVWLLGISVTLFLIVSELGCIMYLRRKNKYNKL